jgi:phospholipase C
MKLLSLLALLALCDAGPKIVYVMVENRSFDVIFGARKGVNGLLGKTFSNSVNNSELGAAQITFSFDINTCDPDHNVGPTTEKIFGVRHALGRNLSDASMGGFVETEAMLNGAAAAGLKYCQVMSGFAPGMLPVSEFLADNFALFDEYFSSVPGPTFPNRFFALTGTSAGNTATGPWYQDTVGLLFPQRTIFEQLANAGRSVAFYYQGTPWELQLRGVLHNPEMLHPYEQFLSDAASGSLPDFSFINPRAGIEPDAKLGCNDYHPQHDAALGEAFLKDIYDAVRNGPDW